MSSVDRKDIVGGGALVVIGIAVATHSIANMSLGTLMRMGPGMFPAALGLILSALGILLVLPALRKDGTMPSVAWRPMLAVLGSLLVFAFAVTRLGVILSIPVLVLIGTRADRRVTIVGALLLSAVLSAIVTSMVVFLNLPFRLVPW